VLIVLRCAVAVVVLAQAGLATMVRGINIADVTIQRF